MRPSEFSVALDPLIPSHYNKGCHIENSMPLFVLGKATTTLQLLDNVCNRLVPLALTVLTPVRGERAQITPSQLCSPPHVWNLQVAILGVIVCIFKSACLEGIAEI